MSEDDEQQKQEWKHVVKQKFMRTAYAISFAQTLLLSEHRRNDVAIGAPAIDSEVVPGEPASVGFYVDEGSPLIDADEMQPGKMSKAEEAHTDVHMRIHKPYNEYCAVCVRAKSRNKKAHKNV